MAKLWFEDYKNQEREIATVNNWGEVWKAINKFIKTCNANKPKGEKPFVSYYSRVWQSGERWKIDVGSHYEFFYTDLPYDMVGDDS